MLKVLLKKQLKELTAFIFQSGKKGKRRSKPAAAGFVLLLLISFFTFAGLFFAMANILCKPLMGAGLGWLYFAIMGITATALGVIGSVFITYSAIFAARDNELLIAMPIPPEKLLLSRMAGVYVMNLLFEIAAMIPAYVAYFIAISAKPDLYSIISSAVCCFLTLFILPLLAMAISCLLGWIIAIIAPYIRNKSMVISVLSLLFMAAYYYIYFKAYSLLQVFLANSTAIGKRLKIALFPLYLMGRGLEGGVGYFLIFAAITLAVFAVVYVVLSRSFLKLATTKRQAAKTVYREKKIKAYSQNGALLKKEFKRFYRSSIYMLNCGLGAVLMLIGAVLIIVKGNWLVKEINAVYPDMGEGMALLALCIICLVASMNVVTAPSISLEGNTLWLLKSLPVHGYLILRAKIKLHMLITAIPALCCAFAAIFVLKPGVAYGILMPVTVWFFVLFCAQIGLILNLKIPNLDWSNEAVPVKQSMSVLFAMMGGFAVVIALGTVYLAVDNYLSGEVYLSACAAVLLLATLFLNLWLKRKGSEQFARL